MKHRIYPLQDKADVVMPERQVQSVTPYKLLCKNDLVSCNSGKIAGFAIEEPTSA